MAPSSFLLLSSLSFGFILCCSGFVGNEEPLSRADFPKNFIFGTGSSSYQYEGGVNEGGRGPTIWDSLAHTPGKILDGSNGDVAEDQYHRYKEDIQLMKYLGVDAYRFSIAWSRIFPEGRGTEPNEAGISHYNDLINNLLANGIKPYVTISHFDLPQALQDSYQGWVGPQVVEDYVAYANICFSAFGDRVKHWLTFNEPRLFIIGGYINGLMPGNSSLIDPSIDPYVVAHHFLLAHSAATQLYRKTYQEKQKGYIGIALDTRWFVPLTDTWENKMSAKRALDFEFGWFMDPLFFGKYPASMRKIVGDRLPKFSKEESVALKGSVDYVGINHYTSLYAREASPSYKPEGIDMALVGYYKDTRVEVAGNMSGRVIGPEVNGQYILPWGFKMLLQHIKRHYNNPTLVITENGVRDPSNVPGNASDGRFDWWRINYMRDYLRTLATAIREGTNVKAYFAWSLLDNWEWNLGYTMNYGLYYVDRTDNLKRHPKASASWYKRFLEPNIQPEKSAGALRME